MKKIISAVVLVTVMIMSMTVGAFAETKTIDSISIVDVVIPTRMAVDQTYEDQIDKLLIFTPSKSVSTTGSGQLEDQTMEMVMIEITEQQKDEMYEEHESSIVYWNGKYWTSIESWMMYKGDDSKPEVGKNYVYGIRTFAEDPNYFSSNITFKVNGNDYTSNTVFNFSNRFCWAIINLGELQADGTFKPQEVTKKTGADTSDANNIALYGLLAVLALAGAGCAYKKREN